MWNDKSIAVVLPTYNEHLSIAECIHRFEALGIVDHIIVVNNNAHPDTSPAVAETSALEVFEPVQGYGAAIQRGLAEALHLEVDLISICEPDGTSLVRGQFKNLFCRGQIWERSSSGGTGLLPKSWKCCLTRFISPTLGALSE
jgi:glycosyltransferase involved in cell wall biosynthesis